MGDDGSTTSFDSSQTDDSGATTYFGTDYSAGNAPDNSVASLTASDPTSTGTSNYTTDSGYTGSTGSVLNTSANPVTTNSGPVDASGGTGSIPTTLQDIATQGLNDAAISATEFGLGTFNDLLRIGANKVVTAASAPSAPTAVAQMPVPTWVWLAGAAVVVFMLVRK